MTKHVLTAGDILSFAVEMTCERVTVAQSCLRTTIMPGSEDEDEDFVPTVQADSSSSSDSEEESPNSKRPRIQPSDLVDPEAEQRKKKELWKAFQDSVASSANATASKPAAVEMIRIEKKYIFAGKEIREIVQVPRSSADAKKWPVVSSSSDAGSSAAATATPYIPASSSTSTSTPAIASDSSLSQKPPGPRKRPRKSKLILDEIPRAGGHSLKDLTMLEKSSMDWKAHLSEKDSPAMKDELEANRREGGGGYLEKVEFLDRVSERRESLLDASKNGKRRRG
ncbi:hypothetical protein D9757_003875 [Collybiopsis confluens]|uniref:SWR1-complex protein 5 n=1 Tax=Collybiopsis confluens TaxID=2823264 RepID=A0A8H5HV65_9AGAR|nr:hypothetical protein D9757_003875 [Collybiopsis confluens]